MPDYQKGRVYKIISDQTDRVYIGSTTNPLSDRMAQHRRAHRGHLAGRKGRMTSSEILQYEDAQIVLIEDYACDRKEQLHARERYHIEQTTNCVNKVVPGRTQAEYHEANREVILERMREYRAANRDVILEKKREYNAANREALLERRKVKHACECGGKFTTGNKVVHARTKKHQDFLANAALVIEPIPIL